MNLMIIVRVGSPFSSQWSKAIRDNSNAPAVYDIGVTRTFFKELNLVDVITLCCAHSGLNIRNYTTNKFGSPIH
jgi:hypothetical protein